MTIRAKDLPLASQIAAMTLSAQSQVWNWLDMENGDERSDDAIVKITDAKGAVICSATAGWLKAVSLYPPSDEQPDESSLSDSQRSILSLRRRLEEVEDERDRLRAALRKAGLA
jgi:hypothetical protein